MDTAQPIIRPCQLPESARDAFQVVDHNANENHLAKCLSDANHFITMLWPDPVERELYLWRHDSGSTTVTYHDSERDQMAQDAVTWAHSGETVFYGVSLDRRELGARQRATKDTVAVVPAIFADIETKGHRNGKGELAANQERYPDRETALGLIQRMPLDPGCILDTGGGFHVYWLLDKPYRIRFEDIDGKRRQVSASVNRIATIQKKWVELLSLYFSEFPEGVDIGVKDLPRPLRLPGTKNHKYGTTVRFVDDSPPKNAPRYSVQDFEFEIDTLLGQDEEDKKRKWTKEEEEDVARDAIKHLELTSELDEYNAWAKIGAALYSVSPSLEMEFHEWSRTSPKYNEAECHRQWINSKKYSTITLGTLIHHARKQGWVPPREKRKENVSVKCEDEGDETAAKHGGLELVAVNPRETPTKIIVPTIVRLDGNDIDRLDITTAASSRAHSERQIAKATGIEPQKIALLVGKLLLNAEMMIREAKSRTQDGETVGDIVTREVPPRFELKFLSERGNAYSQKRNRDVSRQEFTSFTPRYLLDMCRDAIDAPRNSNGTINERTLISYITATLGVVWADETAGLPAAEHDAALDYNSSKGDEFREGIIKAWNAQVVFQTLMDSLKDTDGELYNKKVSLKHEALVEYRGAKLNDFSQALKGGRNSETRNLRDNSQKKWRQIGAGRTHDAYIRMTRLANIGLLPVLAMRHTLLSQANVKIPGVTSPQSFKKLGIQYGAFLPEAGDKALAILGASDIPDDFFVSSDKKAGDSDNSELSLSLPTRMSGGARLCVLHPRLTAEILAEVENEDDETT